MRSPNFNERADGQRPSMILLHYTGMQSGQAALERLCDPEAQVSAHYVVEEDGSVHELVDPDKRAWHAGVSFWRGERDINSVSVGIEIVNPGHEFGYCAFPETQMNSVAALCHEIVERYDMNPHMILGHSDVAPSRKQDPGELFCWTNLARRGLGVWPKVSSGDLAMGAKIVGNETEIQALLRSIGYDPEASYEDIVTAFQRHFNPHPVLAGQGSVMDATGAARLLALVRQIK